MAAVGRCRHDHPACRLTPERTAASQVVDALTAHSAVNASSVAVAPPWALARYAPQHA
jgi:hypothetical protein